MGSLKCMKWEYDPYMMMHPFDLISRIDLFLFSIEVQFAYWSHYGHDWSTSKSMYGFKALPYWGRGLRSSSNNCGFVIITTIDLRIWDSHRLSFGYQCSHLWEAHKLSCKCDNKVWCRVPESAKVCSSKSFLSRLII